MTPPGPIQRLAMVAVLASAALPAAGQDRLTVVDVRPAPRSLAAPTDGKIVVEFDRPVERASVTPASFWAFGRWSGPARGELAFSRGGRRVTLQPERRFSAGEAVMVVLSHDLRGEDGTALRAAGYSFQFWTRSRGAGFAFEEIDRFSTRSRPGQPSRAYGGLGSDLDGDGFLDLTIVNEDTNDLRTFLNRGDRSGRLRRMLEPAARVGDTPSPSEPGDFDGDGHVDVAVANIVGGTVSILLGNGDGTFAAAQNVPVGGEPRGLAVLDADGDGDVDVAATSFVEGSVTVLRNDGRGRFGDPIVFGDGNGERALAAADMNGDGVLDLVVGALGPNEIQVWTGNGDGTFTLAGRQDAGGEVWMLALGDVDGDGDEDVASVNSNSDHGAILSGDGAGGLAPPRAQPTDPFPLATDLADLDGDCDLDWVTSSFFGGWMLFENDGAGSFTHAQTFAAPEAASCSIPLDLDNDGVLDLALIDELADRVVLLRNPATLFAVDFEAGDAGGWSRVVGPVAVVGPGLRGSGHALEVTAAGGSAPAYVESRHPQRESSLVVSFDLDLGDLELGNEPLELLRLGARRWHALLTLERDGRNFRTRLLAREPGGVREVGSTRLRGSGAVRIGIEWSAASGRAIADGRAALVRGKRVRAVAADLANHGQVVGRVGLGLPSGAPDAAGSFLIDRYVSRR